MNNDAGIVVAIVMINCMVSGSVANPGLGANIVPVSAVTVITMLPPDKESANPADKSVTLRLVGSFPSVESGPVESGSVPPGPDIASSVIL